MTTSNIGLARTRKKYGDPDGVQEFWTKKVDSLHEGVSGQMSDILNEKIAIPACMTLGGVSYTSKIHLCGNDLQTYLLPGL